MFNFVIFGSGQDLYRISYSELIALDNVRYVSTPYDFKNPLLRIIYKIHFSLRINKYIKLPFKNMWNYGYYKGDFGNKSPICFIFFHNWCEFEKYGLIKYLHKKYPDSKMVCFFQDLIELQNGLDIYHVKNVFDLVISYDSVEAKRYNINYHPTVYSKSLVAQNDEIQKSDVYFLGAAKNRLAKIILIYQYLQSKGLKCEFYLTNVNPHDQLHYEGIHYIQQMSYQENLQHILKSACILEVMQENATGYTMRTWEAIMYDKKLLTNNIEVRDAPFYNDKYISIFSEITDIDIAFLNDSSNNPVDYNYKEQLSPKKLLSFIVKKLS